MMMPPRKRKITTEEKRIFYDIKKKNAIGVYLILLGTILITGYLLSDKDHLHEKIVLIVSVLFIAFGAHLLTSGPVERALKSIADAVHRVREKHE